MSAVDYDLGDVIEYRPFGGGLRRLRVTVKDADVKNGRPGFEGDLLTPDPDGITEVWGYDDQITRVLR